MHRPNLTAIVLCTWIGAALSLTATSAHAGDPLAYLSWGAPWGQPGAREHVRVSGDSTRVDTLYLSFDPGSDAPKFVGLTALLYFWPQSGDTLGAFWHFERTAENPMACRIDFDVAPYEAMSPFTSSGMGMPRYDHSKGSGRLSFIYAVPANNGVALKAGTIYCLARVFLSHRRASLSGHAQPLCIQWGEADFSVDSELSTHARGAGSPYVTWNSPDGKACGAVTRADSTRVGKSAPGAGKPASGKPKKP